MNPLPSKYAWLDAEPGPRMLLEARKMYGTLEVPGTPDNPEILKWADEVAGVCQSAYHRWADGFYTDDSIPWCGLFMAVIACRSADGRPERLAPNNYLSALAWAAWGVMIPTGGAALGDVLIFVRPGGGHVGMYVGEDESAYHVIGGNQADSVCITRIGKTRLKAVRRPPYRVQPENVRKIRLTSSGVISTNEG